MLLLSLPTISAIYQTAITTTPTAVSTSALPIATAASCCLGQANRTTDRVTGKGTSLHIPPTSPSLLPVLAFRLLLQHCIRPDRFSSTITTSSSFCLQTTYTTSDIRQETLNLLPFYRLIPLYPQIDQQRQPPVAPSTTTVCLPEQTASSPFHQAFWNITLTIDDIAPIRLFNFAGRPFQHRIKDKKRDSSCILSPNIIHPSPVAQSPTTPPTHLTPALGTAHREPASSRSPTRLTHAHILDFVLARKLLSYA